MEKGGPRLAIGLNKGEGPRVTKSGTDGCDPSFMRPKIGNANSRVAKLCRNSNGPKAMQSSTSSSKSNLAKPRTGVESSRQPKLFEDRAKPKQETSNAKTKNPSRISEKMEGEKPECAMLRIDMQNSECKRSRANRGNPILEQLKNRIAESTYVSDLRSKDKPNRLQSNINIVEPELAAPNSKADDSGLSILLGNKERPRSR